MDSAQELLDAYDAREVGEWHRNKALQLRYKSAAEQAHKIRNVTRLVHGLQVLAWDDMQLNCQRHLIADAKNVAENPSITAAELHQMFKERLIAGGDADNPELGMGDENTQCNMDIEAVVLEHLKRCLSDVSITTSDY